MQNHEDSSTEEYVLNSSFQAYVLETNTYDKDLWEKYFILHPEQVINGDKASNIILLLSNTRKQEPSTKDEDYQRLMHSIDRHSRLQLALNCLLPAPFPKIKYCTLLVMPI